MTIVTNVTTPKAKGVHVDPLRPPQWKSFKFLVWPPSNSARISPRVKSILARRGHAPAAPALYSGKALNFKTEFFHLNVPAK